MQIKINNETKTVNVDFLIEYLNKMFADNNYAERDSKLLFNIAKRQMNFYHKIGVIDTEITEQTLKWDLIPLLGRYGFEDIVEKLVYEKSQNDNAYKKITKEESYEESRNDAAIPEVKNNDTPTITTEGFDVGDFDFDTPPAEVKADVNENISFDESNEPEKSIPKVKLRPIIEDDGLDELKEKAEWTDEQIAELRSTPMPRDEFHLFVSETYAQKDVLINMIRKKGFLLEVIIPDKNNSEIMKRCKDNGIKKIPALIDDRDYDNVKLIEGGQSIADYIKNCSHKTVG